VAPLPSWLALAESQLLAATCSLCMAGQLLSLLQHCWGQPAQGLGWCYHLLPLSGGAAPLSSSALLGTASPGAWVLAGWEKQARGRLGGGRPAQLPPALCSLSLPLAGWLAGWLMGTPSLPSLHGCCSSCAWLEAILAYSKKQGGGQLPAALLHPGGPCFMGDRAGRAGQPCRTQRHSQLA